MLDRQTCVGDGGDREKGPSRNVRAEVREDRNERVENATARFGIERGPVAIDEEEEELQAECDGGIRQASFAERVEEDGEGILDLRTISSVKIDCDWYRQFDAPCAACPAVLG